MTVLQSDLTHWLHFIVTLSSWMTRNTPPTQSYNHCVQLMNSKGIYFTVTEHHRSHFWQWQEDKPQRTPSLGDNLSVVIPTQFPSAAVEIANCPLIMHGLLLCSAVKPLKFQLATVQLETFPYSLATRNDQKTTLANWPLCLKKLWWVREIMLGWRCVLACSLS